MAFQQKGIKGHVRHSLLTILIEDLAMGESAGKQTDLELLDFSKAFDKVNPLLWKLKRQCTVLDQRLLGEVVPDGGT